MTPEERIKADELIRAYYEGNKTKNKGAGEERRSLAKVEVLLKDEKEPFSLAIDNKLTMVAGQVTETKIEIDARKVFELYPDKFWELVDIPITTATIALGEKGATKCSREVVQTKFKIVKDKQ